MATQQANIAAAFLRLTNAINVLTGRAGTLASLTTTDKTSLVAALNEVRASIPVLASIINDAATANGTTWSSTKIQAQITAAITALVSGAPEAQNTLAELAAQITALAQADAGLLSFTQAQTLTAEQKAQVGANLGLGDPAHNYVTAIESALNAGL
jgi:hypothetical protein